MKRRVLVIRKGKTAFLLYRVTQGKFIGLYTRPTILSGEYTSTGRHSKALPSLLILYNGLPDYNLVEKITKRHNSVVLKIT